MKLSVGHQYLFVVVVVVVFVGGVVGRGAGAGGKSTSGNHVFFTQTTSQALPKALCSSKHVTVQDLPPIGSLLITNTEVGKSHIQSMVRDTKKINYLEVRDSNHRNAIPMVMKLHKTTRMKQQLNDLLRVLSPDQIVGVELPYVFFTMFEDQIEQFDEVFTNPHSKEIVRSAPTAVSSEHLTSQVKTGTLNKPLEPSDLKTTIVNSLNPDVYMTYVEKLSGAQEIQLKNGTRIKTLTRSTLGPQIIYDTHYISEFFTDLGYTAQLQPFRVGSTTAYNVIGIKRGSVDPNKIVVVGGHYDSTSQKASTLAPGAVDNASGASAVLALAKAFAQYNSSITIHFITFSGEEQGLYGSEYYVDEAVRNKLNIVSALINDMICYVQNDYGVTIEGQRAWSNLMNVMKANTEQFSPKLSIALTYYSWGSDHVPFQRAGIPAFLSIEADETDYPYYHDTGDTSKNCNAQLGIDIARGLAGTLFDIAQPFQAVVNDE